MGITGFIKKQFIDVIEWTEDSDGVLAYRFPMQDTEIQSGAKLTVRESQFAVFIDEGKIADVFEAGLYTLKTQTLPLLTNLKNWDKLFESPFKSDVYFFSNRIQLNRKWGTSNPITLRDKEFGIVRIRAFGIYSYRVSNPKKFFQQISGTKEIYTTEEVEGQLRNTIVSGISTLLGVSNVAFVDMAANQSEFSSSIKLIIDPIFNDMGLTLETLILQNISLPEPLQTILDSKIGVNMFGGIQDFTKYQVASSIPLAAKNEGGIAGLGASIGAGVGIGQQFSQMLANVNSPAINDNSESMDGLNDEAISFLEKLHNLLTKGVITQQEFDVKKTEILKKLT